MTARHLNRAQPTRINQIRISPIRINPLRISPIRINWRRRNNNLVSLRKEGIALFK
ncbi:MAG: hypothetical protein N2201_07295 [candidate division WOR-3 bacterium]|nr:hypothetical protein [candidate division WOR-3 bacterium]